MEGQKEISVGEDREQEINDLGASVNTLAGLTGALSRVKTPQHKVDVVKTFISGDLPTK